MFDWLINGVQDFRIDFAFPAYEEKEKVEHARLAERKFCTERIIKQIDGLMEKPNQEANTLYKTPIVNVSLSITAISNEIEKWRSHKSYFSRNYSIELKERYEIKTKLYSQREQLHLDKTDATKRLNRAKNNISNWHSNAEPLFGEKRDMPQYSFFGPSLSDLDDYKDGRDKAYRDIEDCNKKITNNKAEVKGIIIEIDSIKHDRQRMLDLKDDGLNLDLINKILSEKEKNFVQLNDEKKQLEIDLGKFLEQAKLAQGVDHLEAEIKRMNALKQDFLVSFDSPRAKEARKIAHRVEWLREHL